MGEIKRFYLNNAYIKLIILDCFFFLVLTVGTQ